MDVKPGDVVVLKSGGQALTVAEVNDQHAECIWIGEEGELFRETLPLIVLESAVHELADEDESEQDEEDDGDEENGDDEDEDEGEADEEKAGGGQREVA